MKFIKDPNKRTWNALIKRPSQSIEAIEAIVLEVFQEVKKKGDKAVIKYTQLFDGVSIDSLKVSTNEIEAAITTVPDALKQAIQLATSNIEAFHSAQQTDNVTVETMPGVQCWQEKRPIENIGLYIPGGSAPLFSTILMLAIPATIAGCKQITLCTPPKKDGTIDPAILYTAQLCGVSSIYKVGGIQAIGAMTFGTETIPACYKLFGPGNQFVTVAKQMATKYGVAIDMPAGPSELLVYADISANPAFIASDLLSQAEHGEDSQVVFVTPSEMLVGKVNLEIDKQLSTLPRKDIAEKAMANSMSILIKNETKALDFINAYAPEHFIVVSENENFFIENIRNAGSVFIGNYTPESAGDYASGTNHTLPTNGFAKQYSGVNLDSFMTAITFQKISEKGLKAIGPAIELMALAEGLTAHKNAITIRLK